MELSGNQKFILLMNSLSKTQGIGYMSDVEYLSLTNPEPTKYRPKV